MVHLSRTVRFVVNPPGIDRPGANGTSGNPPLRRLAPFHELEVVCGGEPQKTTGYLVNIKTIDEAVREAAVPRIAAGVWAGHDDAAAADPARILADVAGLLERSLPVPLVRARWHVTPFESYEMNASNANYVVVRTRFEFSASHRLHVPEWSDDENLKAFGKCAHPSGHGHNYGVEPAVRLPVDEPIHRATDLIEELVNEAIIVRFDHKHLNVDTAEFGPEGVNPSVENIARVCFDRLKPVIERDLPGASLSDVTVWETPKTSATYPAH